MPSRLEVDLLTDEPAELFGGLHRLQSAIKTRRCLDITVAKKPADGFVVAGTMLQINCCGSVPELMNCEAKSGRFLHAHSDLLAEQQFVLVLTGLAREQPGSVRPAQQRRPELVNILVEQIR